MATATRTTGFGDAPLTDLHGVGPALASALARLGLERVRDAWFHLPLRYEDRTRVTPVAGLVPGEAALVEGMVKLTGEIFHGRREWQLLLEDDAGAVLCVRFFHYRRAQVHAVRQGQRLRVFGEPRWGMRGLEMVHPEYAAVTPASTFTEALTPVYPSTEGLGQKRLTKVVDQALECLPADAELECLPADVRAAQHLGSLRDALLFVHHPPPGTRVAELLEGQHPAIARLVFEELLARHLSLRLLRVRARSQHAPRLAGSGRLTKPFLASLPFTPTAAQTRVSGEVAVDLAQAAPMLRLVQGDVGSGKTVVAALAALTAIENNRQVALVAPTELLAEQHLATFKAWFEPLGIKVVWLASRIKGRARKAALAAIADDAAMVIGTHALMQDGVAFARLGLIIIDEQHRFGVHQRLALRDKGRQGAHVPHQLVLTATPIPRTLAMSAYADLDVSSIDELPPGRTPVKTVVVSGARRGAMVERIHAALSEGRQAYWVCTLIEDSEQLEAQAAQTVHDELAEALPDCRIGLVHGRMKAAEKQAAMAAFKAGDTQLLVATTVIEVGVDVPNASVMIIENAERLGLAQLHQLRGRVGRGAVASSCVLMYQAPLSRLARERLEVMRATTDGFRIAEKDLELRGPGEVLGTRQTGEMSFRVADLARDAHWLPAVEAAGKIMLAEHPRAARALVARWVGAGTRYADA